jgi:competence protein ComEA
VRRLVAALDLDRFRLDQVRVNPGRGAARAMGIAAVLAIGVAGFWVLAARPHRLAAVSAAVQSSASPASGGSLASPLAPASSPVNSGSSSALVVIDVVGKVERAGVYRLPSGSRVIDAITAAGGVRPGTDLTSVNLAQKLTDGEQIAVGVPVAAAAPVTGGTDPAAGALVDLNNATETQFDALPGVGPVLAQRIVDWRTAHGGFSSVDQLNSVSGIGDAKFADLKPLVTVS